MFFIFIIVWIICSILSYGFAFAYFQRKYLDISEMKYYEDMEFCLICAIGGPLLLIAEILLQFSTDMKIFNYGLKFK